MSEGRVESGRNGIDLGILLTLSYSDLSMADAQGHPSVPDRGLKRSRLNRGI